MKIICTRKHYNGNILSLTVGKVYEILEIIHIPFSSHRLEEINPFLKIKDDNGNIQHYPSDIFREITIEEIREINLNKTLK
jgi:hypothetical protein